MSLKLDDIVENFKEKAPEIVKENKGALLGAVAGYLLTDSKQAQSTIVGAIAGALLLDKKKED